MTVLVCVSDGLTDQQSCMCMIFLNHPKAEPYAAGPPIRFWPKLDYFLCRPYARDSWILKGLRVFFDSPTIRTDLSDLQGSKKPATRVTLKSQKKDARKQRAEKAKLAEDAEREASEQDRKRQRKLELKSIASNRMKAMAVAQMANTQQLTALFEIRKVIDEDPAQLRLNMEEHIKKLTATSNAMTFSIPRLLHHQVSMLRSLQVLTLVQPSC